MNIVSETSDISHLGAEAERGKAVPWLERLNDIVGMLVEFPAALLVAAEVVVLLMGVIWRYVLHTPVRRTAFSHRCPDGDDPAFARANHHRLGNRRCNSGVLYRLDAAGRR